MKKIFLAATALFSTLGFYSCSDDFEVGAPYKNVTFVYGLLNASDTAHYIRIQKAFFDENKGALTLAQVSDSSYYTSLDVLVREVSNGNVVNTTTLTRVNLNDEGIIKDTGAFFSSPHYAYKFKYNLNATHSYRLVVSNSALGLSDSSEIKIVDTGDTKFYVPNANQANFNFNFQNTSPINPIKTNYLCILPANTSMIEAKIKIYWMDKNTQNGEESDHSAEHILTTAFASGSTTNISFANLDVYYFLQGAIGDAPPNVERYLDSCDFTVSVGGKDLYDYFRIVNSAGGGLTADLISPLYTNIKGKDVYGIFSTRTSKVYYKVPFSLPTIDSFKVNPITSGLKIVGVSPK